MEWGRPSIPRREGPRDGFRERRECEVRPQGLHPIATCGFDGLRQQTRPRKLRDGLQEFYEGRRGLPVLAATTLFVPGYVDAEEVGKIAGFMASLDETIPYSLLVFHPDFMMQDLPITPSKQAFEAYRTAKKHLKNVELGNIHLLYRQQSEMMV
jgi:hypothetical protein